MTPRDQDDPSLLPELLVIVASCADAAALAPLAHPDLPIPAPVRPVLVATGPDPMEVDEALDDAGTPAGRVLVVDDPAAGPSRELAILLPRLDDLLSDALPGGIVIRGGSTAALAAVHAAVARRVPVIHLPVNDVTGVEAAQQAAIGELVAWQTTPTGGLAYPAELDLLVHRRLAPDDASRLVPIAHPARPAVHRADLTA
jgi:hypothetical protein